MRMRALPASVLLSLLVLGGSLNTARAQDPDLDNPPALNPVFGEQTDSGEVPSAVIPLPSLAFPGVVAGVTVGELYTDNLELASPGSPRESSWITQIQPFIRASTNSPRFKGLVNYTLTGYLYAGQSDHNQVAQHLDANGSLAIIQSHLFLDGAAGYGRQIIDQQKPVGGGTFFLDGNQANAARASLSPYWVQDFGRAGTMMLRYFYGRVMYNDRGIPGENDNLLNGVSNVTSNAYQFSLTSPKYQTWGWNVMYSEQHMQPDSGQEVEFAIARLGTSLQVNYGFRLLADAGKETNFLPDGTIEKLGASFWDVGFQWSNGRDNVRMMTGHRFYGSSYQLSWSHQAARLTTSVSYEESPTTYNQQLLGFNPGGGGVPPINNHPQIPSLTDTGPYLSKRLTASANYTMPKGKLSARVYDERRTQLDQDGGSQRVEGAGASWLLDLNGSTNLTTSVGWLRRGFEDGQVSTNRSVTVALVHRLNTKNYGSVRVRHGDGNVDDPSPGAHGHTVNVLFVQWTHLF